MTVSFKRTYKDWIYAISVYECDGCGEEIDESYRHVSEDNNTHYCIDCGFRLEKMTSKEYCRSCGIDLDGVRAGINPDTGEIELVCSGRFEWERTNRQSRNTVEYISWRENVYKRDNFTCQNCGKRGGNLQAHHIKPFSRFKRYRYVVSNGVTLCSACHKKVHKKGVCKDEIAEHIRVYPFIQKNHKQPNNRQTTRVPKSVDISSGKGKLHRS